MFHLFKTGGKPEASALVSNKCLQYQTILKRAALENQTQCREFNSSQQEKPKQYWKFHPSCIKRDYLALHSQTPVYKCGSHMDRWSTKPYLLLKREGEFLEHSEFLPY